MQVSVFLLNNFENLVTHPRKGFLAPPHPKSAADINLQLQSADLFPWSREDFFAHRRQAGRVNKVEQFKTIEGYIRLNECPPNCLVNVKKNGKFWVFKGTRLETMDEGAILWQST